MKNVIIYTVSNCKYCMQLKVELDKLNIKYEEKNIDNNINKKELDILFDKFKIDGLPLIIIKPHVIAPKKTYNTVAQAIEIIINLID